MENKIEHRKQYLAILIPVLIVCFWPFPSKWIGYSAALYISDAVLIGTLFLLAIKNKYKPENNVVNKFLIAFIILNIIASILAIFRSNFWGIRQFAEIIRMIEWFIMYHYLYQTLKEIETKNEEKILYKVIFIVMIGISVISTIELFDIPVLKDGILKNIYEMGKSGNIFQFFNRISGTFKNPNMFGVFLSMISIILLISRMENKKKIPLIILSVFFLYYTGSRTALIATVLVYIIIIITKLIAEKNKKLLKQQLIIIGIILLAVILVMLINKDLLYSVRLGELFEDLATLNDRTLIWEKFSTDISNHWFIGNGIIKNVQLIFDNVFVQYLYYYGIIGCIMLVTFFIYNLIKAFKSYLKNKEDIVLTFCIVIQLIIIISGITIQIMDVTQLTFFYFLSIAYVDTRKYFQNKSIETGKKEEIEEAAVKTEKQSNN